MFKKLCLIIMFLFVAHAMKAELPTSGNWPAQTISTSQSVALNGYVSPLGTITIASGATLTITVDPTYPAPDHTRMYITDLRLDANRSSIFDIRPRGKLIIIGMENCPIIIEGNGDQWEEPYLHADGLLYPPTSGLKKAYAAPAVRCDGELDFQHVIMQGIYNCSAGQAENNLGVIRFGTTNSGYVSNLDHVTFKRNVGFCGPVFYVAGNTSGTVNMSNCTALQNEAHHISDGSYDVHNGGSIRTTGSSHMVLNITNSTFDHNKSGGNGGAIYASSYNDGSMITLNGCEFSYNHSGLSGGGILFEGNSSLQGTNRFHHNTAWRNGGGISIEGYSQQTTGQAQTINFNLNSGLELDNNYSPCGAGLGINLRASVGYGVGSTINITVDGSNIHDNQASTDYDIGDAHLQGGGIYIINNLNAANNYTVNVNLNGCKINDNVAGMGAGVFVKNANVIGDGASLEISGNKANVSSSNLKGTTPENWNCGGGVVVQSGDLKLKNGVVKSNEALVHGGGAAVLGGGLEIDGCQVGANGSSNKAVKGGGMFVTGGNFTINSGSIQYNNDATIQNGAGIYVQGGNAYVQGGSVSNNKSQAAGAGIYVEGGSVEVSGGSVESNQSPTDGGGIYLSDGTNPGSITISGGSIASNTAANNGGGFYVGGGSVIITGGSITGNNATNANGGGFYVAKGNVNVTNGTISGNMANKGLGGGFFVNTGIVNLEEETEKVIIIKENQAYQGGGVYAGGGNIVLTGAEIQGNKAVAYTDHNDCFGGGVYSNGGTISITNGS